MSARDWAAALALDLTIGEPPEPIHPVVMVGRAIGVLDRAAFARGRDADLAGALIALAPAALAAFVAASASRWRPLGLWWLKTTFALRSLLRSAATVERALVAGQTGEARAAVAAIVGRSIDDLDDRLVASAAIESLAENLNDSYVAPLFWYALGGLPAAAAYRAVNTADAMVGYRTERHARIGRLAARLDDALNLVPARLTALAFAGAAPAVGGSSVGALGAVRRYAGQTASPNSGWPMSAASGALGVRLEKRGHHVLGDGRDPDAHDIARARRLVLAAAAIVTIGFACWKRG